MALVAKHLAETNQVGAPFKRIRGYDGRFIRVCKSDVMISREFGCPLIYCPCRYPRT